MNSVDHRTVPNYIKSAPKSETNGKQTQNINETHNFSVDDFSGQNSTPE